MQNMAAARGAAQEFGADLVVIKKTSKEYAALGDQPPCPSIALNSAFLVKDGVMTQAELKAALSAAR